MITRACSCSFTAGSRGRTKPFSTTPATAKGRREGSRPRCASSGNALASGGSSGGDSNGSAAICSSLARRSALRLSTAGVVIISSSVCGDYKYRYVVQVTEDVGKFILLTVISPDHLDTAARRNCSIHLESAVLSLSYAEHS